LAAKDNDSAADIDLAAYAWVKTCTTCHPGGGPTEFDRDGFRYDERAASGSPPIPEFDGDYHGNAWATSGVLEADCLLCHMSSYRTANRTPEIVAGRFRTAPVAGAFMGSPRSNAVVDYDTGFKLFIQDPSDRSCSQCHAGTPTELFAASGKLKADIAKRGRSWDDPDNIDVHDSVMNCVDCHHSGSSAGQPFQDHQFQKGHIMVGSGVRDDLDNANGWRGCGDCHRAGADVADLPVSPPVPAHARIPGFHLDRIDCSTCHTPRKNLFAVKAFDFLEATKVPFFVGGSPKNPYGGGIQPAYLWWHSETEPPYTWKIYPFNYIASVIWNRGGEERYGLHLPKIGPVYNALVADGKLLNHINDSKGNLPEPNTAQEIDDFRAALIAAGVAADPKIWIAPEPFQLSHNVGPKEEALGSGGCSDCHSTDSGFFSREINFLPYQFEDLTHVRMELHIHDGNGESHAIEGVNYSLPMWRLLGLTEDRKDLLETLFDD
jgi:hypothetical protein